MGRISFLLASPHAWFQMSWEDLEKGYLTLWAERLRNELHSSPGPSLCQQRWPLAKNGPAAEESARAASRKPGMEGRSIPSLSVCVPRMCAHVGGAMVPEREVLIPRTGIPTQGSVSESAGGTALSFAKPYSKLTFVWVFYFWLHLFGSS